MLPLLRPPIERQGAHGDVLEGAGEPDVPDLHPLRSACLLRQRQRGLRVSRRTGLVVLRGYASRARQAAGRLPEVGGPTVSVRVTVEDIETGDTDSAVVGDGDYLVVCTQPAHYTVQAHANGTHVITVKGRKGGVSDSSGVEQ